MSPVLALLVGAALMLLCGGASLWLAKAMWTSRMTALQEENQSLRLRLAEMKEMERLRKGVTLVQREMVSGRSTLEKLDANIFKLTQVVTGEAALVQPNGRPLPWNNAGDPVRSYLNEPNLPEGLGEPS